MPKKKEVVYLSAIYQKNLPNSGKTWIIRNTLFTQAFNLTKLLIHRLTTTLRKSNSSLPQKTNTNFRWLSIRLLSCYFALIFFFQVHVLFRHSKCIPTRYTHLRSSWAAFPIRTYCRHAPCRLTRHSLPLRRHRVHSPLYNWILDPLRNLVSAN